MKKEDKIFAIGISSLFISIAAVLLEAGKIFDPEKFYWINKNLSFIFVSGAVLFLAISIMAFVKFLKLPN